MIERWSPLEILDKPSLELILDLRAFERIARWLGQAVAKRPASTPSPTPPATPRAKRLEGLVELGIWATKRTIS